MTHHATPAHQAIFKKRGTMKLMKRNSAVFRAIGAGALLALGTLHAFGQQIPASSADSGRRAVIAVNQGSIYNGINNAYYTGVNAQNSANIAYNTAVNAQAGADGAAGLAGEAYRRAGEAQNGAMIGAAIDVGGFQPTYDAFKAAGVPIAADSQSGRILRVACFRGATGPNQILKDAGTLVTCPSGSNWVALSVSPGYADQGAGGNGGGGGGDG